MLEQGRKVDAEQEYQAAIAVDPYFPETHRRVVEVLYKCGELAGAQEAAQTAANLAPESAEAWFATCVQLRPVCSPRA
ncbi:MAG: tetratricopeptide repeat protein [Candidatus Zipacnadales bacterium]